METVDLERLTRERDEARAAAHFLALGVRAIATMVDASWKGPALVGLADDAARRWPWLREPEPKKEDPKNDRA